MEPPFSSLRLIIPLLAICFPAFGETNIPIGIEIQPQSRYVVAKKQQPFLLNCSVNANPEFRPLNFTWLKNGRVIEENRKITILKNGSLHFRKIGHKKNKRTYECYVTNKIGTIFAHQVQLHVAEIGKKVEIKPKDQSRHVGGVARFTCHINSIPKPNYQWHKNNKKLQGSRFKKLDGVLQIHDLQPSDGGTYTCMAVPEQASVFLQVLPAGGKVPAHIVAPPVNQTINMNEQRGVILECLADGNPKPKVIWRRQDNLPIDSSVKVHAGYLEIPEVSTKHEAVYICMATNQMGQDIKSAFLEVNVAPIITTDPKGSESKYAMDFPLECDAEGKPQPTLKWFKDGKELVSSAHIQINYNGNLLVKEAELEDSGYYQCLIVNSVGYATVISRMDIIRTQGSPNLPPLYVEVTVLTETDVRVTWRSPSDPSLGASWFVVTWNIVDGNDFQPWFNSKHVDDGFSLRVGKLKPNTRFSFHVRAWNTMGAGPASEVIIVKTKESVPTAIPEITNLTTPMPNAILVKWNPMPLEQARGKIVEYVIFYQHDSTQDQATVSGDKTQHLLTHLKPNTKYFFTVVGKTKAGWPNLKQVNTGKKKEATTLSAPVRSPHFNMSVKLMNNSAVRVTWRLSDNAEIIGYQLMAEKRVGTEQLGPFQFPPSQNFYLLTNLQNNTWYGVTMEALRKNDLSWTASQNILTQNILTMSPANLPLPPGELEGEATSSTGILVKWKKPDTDYTIEKYVVNYTVYDPVNLKANYSTSKLIESKSLNVSITGLNAFQQYRISVRSHTAKAAGEFSNPIFVSTNEDVPCAPENVHSHLVSPTEVEISWKPPHKENGKILFYEIHYTSDEQGHAWIVEKQNGTSMNIKDLKEGEYVFKVRAFTVKGEGDFSKMIVVKKTSVPTSVSPGPIIEPTTEAQDHTLLIVLCVVAAATVFICVIIVVIRFRCCKGGNPRFSPGETNQQPPTHTGNGSIHRNGHQANGHATIPRDSVEMESYVNILNTLPENSNVDAKGGGNLVLHPGIYKNGLAFPNHNGHMQNNGRTQEEQRLLQPLLTKTAEQEGQRVANGNQLGNSLEDIDRSDLDLSTLPDDMDDSSTPLVTGNTNAATGQSSITVSRLKKALQSGELAPEEQSTDPAGIGTPPPLNQGSAVVPAKVNSGNKGVGLEEEGEELMACQSVSGQTSGNQPNIPLSGPQSNQTTNYELIGKGGPGEVSITCQALPTHPPLYEGSTGSGNDPSNASVTSSTILPPALPVVNQATPLLLADSKHLNTSESSQRHLGGASHRGNTSEAEPQSANQQISSQPRHLHSSMADRDSVRHQFDDHLTENNDNVVSEQTHKASM